MIDDRHDELSADGRARRDAMLTDLIATMRSTRRHRNLRRRGAGILAVALVVIGCAWAVGLPLPGTSLTTHVVGRNPIEPGAAVDSGSVKSTPVVTIVRHAHRTGRVRVISDDGLLQVLDDVGRSAGLIRSEGRTWLTTAVTDAQRSGNEEASGQPGAL